MKQLFANLYFFLQLFFVFSSEVLYFRVHRSNETYVDRLLLRLSKTNILYIKLFQAIALNNNLISEETNKKLLSFTDNAPYTDADIDFHSLLEVMTKHKISLLNYNYPINSGMISIVFKGIKEPTGKIVAIKMKRKNIDAKLQYAIDRFNFIIYLLSFIPALQNYEIPSSIQENLSILKEQTDFIKEVKNMTFVKENCKRLHFVMIPDVYENITNEFPNFIVTEFVEGLKVQDVAKKDRIEFSQLFNKFTFISLFVHGVSHGDMHAGNVLFYKDKVTNVKKIVLIDFGVLYKLNKDFRDSLFDFCYGIFSMDPMSFAIQTLDSYFFSPKGIMKTLSREDRDHLVNMIKDFVSEVQDNKSSAGQMNIYNFFFDLNTYTKEKQLDKYGIRLSDDFIKLQMFIAMSQGVSMTLAGDKYIELANQAIYDLYKKTVVQFL